MRLAYVRNDLSSGAVYLKAGPCLEWTSDIRMARRLTPRDALGLVERLRGWGGAVMFAYAAWVADDGTPTPVRLEDLPPTAEQVADAEKRVFDMQDRVNRLREIERIYDRDSVPHIGATTTAAMSERDDAVVAWTAIVAKADQAGGAS